MKRGPLVTPPPRRLRLLGARGAFPDSPFALPSRLVAGMASLRLRCDADATVERWHFVGGSWRLAATYAGRDIEHAIDFCAGARVRLVVTGPSSGVVEIVR